MLCPARVQRALKQPIYLRDVDLSACTQADAAADPTARAVYQVEGTSMTVYTVEVSRARAACTCPDFCTRGLPCKHIIFVLARVHRLDVVGHDMPQLLAAHWAAVVQAKPYESRSALTLDGDCCVCLDALCEPVWTCVRCSNSLHAACMRQWRRGCRGEPTCPLCRAPL